MVSRRRRTTTLGLTSQRPRHAVSAGSDEGVHQTWGLHMPVESTGITKPFSVVKRIGGYTRTLTACDRGLFLSQGSTRRRNRLPPRPRNNNTPQRPWATSRNKSSAGMAVGRENYCSQRLKRPRTLVASTSAASRCCTLDPRTLTAATGRWCTQTQ